MNEVRDLESHGRLQFPAGYSYQNALKSAWLILQDVVDRNNKPALEVCTQVSIANALMDMIIQGLSPAKKQCYFIVRGNKLCLDRSYFGAIHVAKQVTNMVDIIAEVIRDGQDFEFDTHPKTGIKEMKKHVQPFNTLNNQIIGAYAIKKFADGTYKMEIMTRDDIQKAWEQGPMKGKSGAHLNFEGEMCKKTVINRACKIEINTSSDSDIVIAAVNRTIEGEYEDMRVNAEVNTVEETEELANTILGIK
ncbi:MAG: recombinase RecT, partial [Calditrichaeota bacterium]|nr:recombinase RecT [Calditrichota bacterium]